MTDETRHPQPDIDTPPADDNDTDDELGVESALAALASLNTLADDAGAPVEDEADETTSAADAAITERDNRDDLDAEVAITGAAYIDAVDPDDDVIADDLPEMQSAISPRTEFEQPPQSKLYRGQAASIVPAVLLIGIGALLTFLLTTDSLILNAGTLAALGSVGAGVLLLSQWVTSRRWARGSFFMGVLLLLGGGIVLYLLQPNALSLAEGYPLLIVATGVAFVLTSLFARGIDNRPVLIGVLLITAGSAGLLVTSQILADGIVQTLRGLWGVVLAIVVLLVIAPLVTNRDKQER